MNRNKIDLFTKCFTHQFLELMAVELSITRS